VSEKYEYKFLYFGDDMTFDNKKIMVLTTMRTGSTWLTFLVQALTKSSAGFTKEMKGVRSIWKSGGFVKAHKFTAELVFEEYPDAYIITSVRNPKGRNSSQFYFQPPYTEERLKSVLTSSVKWAEQKQLNRMWEGFSSRNIDTERTPHYMWIAYEWMTEDIFKEAKNVCKFLGLNLTRREIKQAIDIAQKETQQTGTLRKGIVGSWKKETFKEELKVLDKYQEMYYNILKGEEHEK